MKGKILRAFGDGVYAFALDFGQIEELQEKTDCGPFELYKRLLSGAWRIKDVTETIRLGLLGGGEGWPGASLNDEGELEGEGDAIRVVETVAVRLVRNNVRVYGAAAFDPDKPLATVGGPRPWAENALLAAQILEAGLMGKRDEPLGKKTPEGKAPDPTPSQTEDSGSPQSSPASPIEG